jgi:Proton-conducting membrane transporter
LGEIGGAGAGGSDLMLVVAAVLVVVGLGFKAGYVPGHFWIPDVYQGATMPIAAFRSCRRSRRSSRWPVSSTRCRAARSISRR